MQAFEEGHCFFITEQLALNVMFEHNLLFSRENSGQVNFLTSWRWGNYCYYQPFFNLLVYTSQLVCSVDLKDLVSIKRTTNIIT